MRSRLWPTRRLFEWRQDRLHAELAGVRTAVEAMHAELRGSAGRCRRPRRPPGVDFRRASRDPHARAPVAERSLPARTSCSDDWPERLAAARSEQTYELAYEDASPLISIPIPTFNSPDTLCDRALASVRAQTHSNWEAIVVGDHCTDDTEARVRALHDPRIRFHNLAVRENDPHDPWERWAVRGSVPRSTGVELAAGRWIAPLSARRRMGSRPSRAAPVRGSREPRRGRVFAHAGRRCRAAGLGTAALDRRLAAAARAIRLAVGDLPRRAEVPAI